MINTLIRHLPELDPLGSRPPPQCGRDTPADGEHPCREKGESPCGPADCRKIRDARRSIDRPELPSSIEAPVRRGARR